MKRKTNDSEEKERPSQKGGRKKRSFYIQTVWEGRCAMQTLLNEIRNGEWSADMAREQRCCIDSIIGYIKTCDLEERLAMLEKNMRDATIPTPGRRRL